MNQGGQKIPLSPGGLIKNVLQPVEPRAERAGRGLPGGNQNQNVTSPVL